jgi:hypothetical protein
MKEPVILIARYWLNLWKPGHRAPDGANVCVALAYGAEHGVRLDLRPRKGGRQKLEAMLLPEIFKEPLVDGKELSLRKPDVKMGVDSQEICGPARVERVMFELKASMGAPMDPLAWLDLSTRLKARSALALEPWLGSPLASRVQWGDDHSGGFFASGGDLGIMGAYLNPKRAPPTPDGPEGFSAWQEMLFQLAALDLAQDVPEPMPSTLASKAGRPRV